MGPMVIQELINNYQSGLNASEVARKFSIHQKTVVKYLRQNNVAIRQVISRPKPVDVIFWSNIEQRNKETIRLYQDGNGAHIISKMLKISKKTVFKILHKSNIPIDTNRIPKHKLINSEEIIKEYQSGKSAELIARDVGVSYCTITRHLKTAKIEIRPPGDTNSAIPIKFQPMVLEWYLEEDLSTYDISSRLLNSHNLHIHPNNIQNFINRKNMMRHGSELKAHIARKQKNKQYRTKPEKIVEQVLKDLNISYDWQYPINGWTFDFKIGNILIEVNGDYWHSLPQRRQRDAKKFKVAIENGYKVCYVWEHELSNINLIINRIKWFYMPKPQVVFNNIVFRTVSFSDCVDFLNSFHYQRAGRAGSTNVAFYEDNMLIAVCVFASVTRLEMAQKQNISIDKIRELTRLCIHPQYQGKNFASWMLARSRKLLRLKEPQIEQLISFADPTFGHKGIVYNADNWKFDGLTPPSYWYVNSRSNIIHKKTVWNEARKNNISEAEQARISNLKKVYGQSKFRFIRKAI